MADKRMKDSNWDVGDGYGSAVSTQHAMLAVLMDIRDELKRINNVLNCSNCLAIPHKLDRIEKNTRKAKKRRRKAVPA